ncbi:MAG: redoxin domain-containing protein [Deltaproteobacteria bacterium]|nr:redoxin domain-containing protein [Deltaproteobacteria bacterium]MBW1930503.1 redoxin domain-containing protein [Deltaproteobacteria bacterium]MBW2026631.1 redoxin domain-containing protein [Deltaproteobacteria bacterium]MBW2126416.1 redoxin domain-containing protein [Deltaproteobacteria bacterium]RLB18511.1 MAG: thiol reductase thioredoxin [Deltaproteobacteria bacterium]
MTIKEIRSDHEFYERIRYGVSLVDFNAPWCAPCRLQEPILKKLASKFEGKATVYSLNVDEHQELARSLKIYNIPTLIVFKDNKEIERIIGLQTESFLGEALKRVLEQGKGQLL